MMRDRQAPQLYLDQVSFRTVRPGQDAGPLAFLWHITQHAVYDNRADLMDLTATRLYLETALLVFCKVLVATIRSEAVGFIAIRNAHISQLHVAPSSQGRGIGKRFLDIAKAESSGLLTLACDRKKVGGFYFSQGFREC